MTKMDAFSLYTKDVDKVKYSSEINNKLIVEYYKNPKEKRDSEIRNKLIELNLRLVLRSVQTFYKLNEEYINSKTNLSIEDLVSAGNIALVRGIDYFNIEKKIKLSTYLSKCIFNELSKCLVNEISYLSAPINFKKQTFEYKRSKNETWFDETKFESAKDYYEKLIATDYALSLDYVKPGTKEPFINLIEDDSKDLIDYINDAFVYENILSTLTEKEKFILIKKALENKTFAEIGNDIGISYQAVEQRYNRIKRKLINGKVKKLLKEY